MSEAPHDEAQPQEQVEEQRPLPLVQSLTYGTGTFLAVSVVDLLAHLGPTGLVVGGIIAYAAAKHGPELVEQVRESLPAPASRPASRHRRKATLEQREDGSASRGKSTRSLLDRALGRFPVAVEEDEPATTLVEEEEDLLLPDTLELGDLRVHVDTVFSKRVTILGMSGSGKSNLVAVLVEELGQFDAALIVFDHKPEYWPLCKQPYLTRPARANAQNLTPQHAAAIGQQIVQKRLHVVVDLTSYQSDVEAVLVMVRLIEGVRRYQQAQSDERRIPCTFVLDEAHYWLPENEAHSTIRHVKARTTGQSLLAYMQQVFFRLSEMGRTFGMGLIVATQRPANVDKRLTSQAEWRFLLKAMDPADLKTYRIYGLAAEVAQALSPHLGEAYVVGPDGSHGVYRIRRRFSPDVAKSPGLANIRNAGPVSDSPIHHVPEGGAFEHPSTPVNGESVKGEWLVNRPEKRVNDGEWGGESSPGPVNAVHAEEQQAGYTQAEEIRVIQAYAELVRTARPGDPPITRTAIMKHLDWNTKHYQRIIKPVCDKYGIAL